MLPTGGGKSICFQVPGIIKEGLTLVISPLIALMKDQVEQLKKRNVRAVALHAGLAWQEVKLVMDNALHGHYKFLYISPERLSGDSFREYLPNLNISMLVVDEAHCVSQWGYDFRPPYLRIPEVQDLFNNPIQTVAFTATATPKVKADIIDKLKLNKPFLFQGDFTRPNLKYGCIQAEDKHVKLIEICGQIKGSGIVFVNSRKESENICQLLQSHNISASFYHAGLNSQERDKRQNAWMKDKSRIMVCTNAFGMGVDKPNVRLVLHMQPSLSPEAYYQEAGRAGRDGSETWCILLYEGYDFTSIQERIDQSDIKESELGRIYNAVLNYIGVPPGGGSEQIYKIDITEIALSFKVQPKRIYNGIKALQILDIWSFDDASWSPSKVRITANHAAIYEAKVKHKEFEKILDFLMRSFSDIFNSYAVINESKIAKYVGLDEAGLKRVFKKLQSLGYIDYQLKSEKSVLFLREERTVYSSFNTKALKVLQKDKCEKFKAMVDYCKMESCRNGFWIKYFLAEKTKDCGNCDNCRSRDREKNSAKEILSNIKNSISLEKITPTEFLNKIPKRSFDKYQKELRWLIDHKHIKLNKEGNMLWQKK